MVDRVTDTVRVYVLDISRASVNREIVDTILMTNTYPGVTIVTDGSKVYNSAWLASQSRLHVKVNHKKHEWVSDDVETLSGLGVGPQAVERAWRSLREMFTGYGAKGAKLDTEAVELYCAEFEWRFNAKLFGNSNAHKRMDSLIELIARATAAGGV